MDVREKLVELLRKSPYNIFGNKLGNCYFDSCLELIADHLIANGVTVQEWISVKDRLPEDYKQRVMVICIGDYPIGYPKIDTDRYVRGHWVRYGIYVSHWMPLPSTEGLE